MTNLQEERRDYSKHFVERSEFFPKTEFFHWYFEQYRAASTGAIPGLLNKSSLLKVVELCHIKKNASPKRFSFKSKTKSKTLKKFFWNAFFDSENSFWKSY